MNIWNVVSQMLMMLAMLAVGYGAAKLHIVTQEGNRTLSAILLSIAFPCMVLSSVSAPGERDDMLLVWSLIAGRSSARSTFANRPASSCRVMVFAVTALPSGHVEGRSFASVA